MKISKKFGAANTRLATIFQDRELFLRTGDTVRFIQLSAKVQRIGAGIAATAATAWLATTAILLVGHVSVADERSALTQKQADLTRSQNNDAAYRDRVDSIARDLSNRQEYLETLTTMHLAPEVAKEPEKTTKFKRPITQSRPVDLAQELAELERVGARQAQFAKQLTAMAAKRADRAERTIRGMGLNPARLASQKAAASGGPYIPAPTGRLARSIKDPVFRKLGTAFRRMATLEQTLLALPSNNPAAVMMMSSGFGYRSDPFTGSGAMHAGLDFRGPIGTPIMASAPGMVSFVGQKSGYGNVVEIDHGRGIMTRYAHLSGFDTQVGAKVASGQRIARMGSTGRSTGSHLHFEVRVNGEALNPRRFLEANNGTFTRQAARKLDARIS